MTYPIKNTTLSVNGMTKVATRYLLYILAYFTLVALTFKPTDVHGICLHESGDIKPMIDTGLPIIYIDTRDAVISKSEYTDCEITIQDEMGLASDTLHASIKYRGNYTFQFQKKPYNIKFKNKVSCIGFAAAKKFVLLANYCDLTLCRTAIGMKLGELVNCDWPIHFRYVELVLNGIHVGNYLMAEAVEIGKNRIDINKQSGVIVEYRYDNQLEAENKFFRTTSNNWLFEFKDPKGDDLSDHLFQTTFDKMNYFEMKLKSLRSTDDSIDEFIDLDSFVKWYYSKNILQMDECNRYYVIEDDNPVTKIRMGPLWDFDWSIGIDKDYNHYTYCYPRNKLYFKYLAQNTYFLTKVAEYHFSNRERLERELMNYYDEISNLIRVSQILDESIWHRCEAAHVNWEDELKTDKDFLHKTFLWLDEYLKSYCPIPTDINSNNFNAFNKEGITYNLRGQIVKEHSSLQKSILIKNREKYIK